VKLEYDPESGALYIGFHDGEIEQTIDLAEPGFGAHMDIDHEGNVLGVEFLSFEEYIELLRRSGGVLQLPNKIDPANFRFGPAPNP
jgi:uncharacterized protein YuzE